MSLFPSFPCDCNGRGVCVPSPIPEYVELCLCDRYFTGRADYFDLRVFRNSTVELSIACTVSEPGANTIWAFFLVALVFRLGFTLLSLKRLVPSKRMRPGVKRLMFVDVVATILAISLPLQKFIDPANAVLGTSAGATMAQTLSTLLMTAVWSVNQLEELMMLTNTRTWEQLWKNRIGKLQIQLQLGFILAYLGITIVSMSALAIDKTLGPIESNLVVVLLFRNLGFLGWSLLMFFGATKMQQREISTRNILMNVPNAERPLKVVEYLELNKRNLKKQVVLLAILYVIFSLPYLWDQQYINIGITTIILAFTSSIGRVLLRSEQVAKNATGDSFNNITATTSSGQQFRPDKSSPQKFGNSNIPLPPPPPLGLDADPPPARTSSRRPHQEVIIAAYAINSVEPSY